MLDLKTRADLQRLIDENLSESLTLEYKASPSLGREDRKRDELCKDASAFANSAGGQIVYGIKEEDHKPVEVDDGCDGAVISREWIEQVISSRVQPRIDGLVIMPVPLDLENHFAYVLTIPQGAARAPHQAPDHKYYKRQNFQSLPMEDYEVRDVLRRASSPELYLEERFEGHGAGQDIQPQEDDESKLFKIVFTVGNNASEPAYYTYLRVYLDSQIEVKGTDFEKIPNGGVIQGAAITLLNKKMGIPGHFPIFREQAWRAGYIDATVPAALGPGRGLFRVGYEITTPGYHIQRLGFLVLENWRLSFLWQ